VSGARALLRDWLNEVLPARLDRIAPASSDASFRRFSGSGTTTRPVSSWMPHRTRRLRHSSPSPRLCAIGAERARGAGRRSRPGPAAVDRFSVPAISGRLDARSVPGLYVTPGALARLQVVAIPARAAAPYDSALLHREMELFASGFSGKLLGPENLCEDEHQRAGIRRLRLLSDNALEQPRVLGAPRLPLSQT